jgi:hypothetical protein
MLLVAGASGTSCYKPNIAPGGLKCSAGSVRCPDGFTCASDNLCYPGDGGPACTSPSPMPTCSDGFDGGTCSPICQTGCECGWCGVSGGATKCLTDTKGTKNVGEVCDPTKDADCSLGLYCRPECGQTAIGRCYKVCSGSSDCVTLATNCGITETSTGPNGSLSFKLCNLPTQQCNPVGATSGCPTTAPAVFACYADSTGTTYCDCKGASTTSCSFFSACVPGDSCIQFGGTNTGTCEPACTMNADCTTPATCNPLAGSPTFGYCI